MSLENGPAVVNIKTLKGRFSSQFKSETYCWTKKLNKEDYGVDRYWVLLAVVKE